MNADYQVESAEERWNYWTDEKEVLKANLSFLKETQHAANTRNYYFGDVDPMSTATIIRQIAFFTDELDHAQRQVAYWWTFCLQDGVVPTKPARLTKYQENLAADRASYRAMGSTVARS
jgi:hypothetical protein